MADNNFKYMIEIGADLDTDSWKKVIQQIQAQVSSISDASVIKLKASISGADFAAPIEAGTKALEENTKVVESNTRTRTRSSKKAKEDKQDEVKSVEAGNKKIERSNKEAADSTDKLAKARKEAAKELESIVERELKVAQRAINATKGTGRRPQAEDLKMMREKLKLQKQLAEADERQLRAVRQELTTSEARREVDRAIAESKLKAALAAERLAAATGRGASLERVAAVPTLSRRTRTEAARKMSMAEREAAYREKHADMRDEDPLTYYRGIARIRTAGYRADTRAEFKQQLESASLSNLNPTRSSVGKPVEDAVRHLSSSKKLMDMVQEHRNLEKGYVAPSKEMEAIAEQIEAKKAALKALESRGEDDYANWRLEARDLRREIASLEEAAKFERQLLPKPDNSPEKIAESLAKLREAVRANLVELGFKASQAELVAQKLINPRTTSGKGLAATDDTGLMTYTKQERLALDEMQNKVTAMRKLAAAGGDPNDFFGANGPRNSSDFMAKVFYEYIETKEKMQVALRNGEAYDLLLLEQKQKELQNMWRDIRKVTGFSYNLPKTYSDVQANMLGNQIGGASGMKRSSIESDAERDRASYLGLSSPGVAQVEDFLGGMSVKQGVREEGVVAAINKTNTLLQQMLMRLTGDKVANTAFVEGPDSAAAQGALDRLGMGRGISLSFASWYPQRQDRMPGQNYGLPLEQALVQAINQAANISVLTSGHANAQSMLSRNAGTAIIDMKKPADEIIQDYLHEVLGHAITDPASQRGDARFSQNSQWMNRYFSEIGADLIAQVYKPVVDKDSGGLFSGRVQSAGAAREAQYNTYLGRSVSSFKQYDELVAGARQIAGQEGPLDPTNLRQIDRLWSHIADNAADMPGVVRDIGGQLRLQKEPLEAILQMYTKGMSPEDQAHVRRQLSPVEVVTTPQQRNVEAGQRMIMGGVKGRAVQTASGFEVSSIVEAIRTAVGQSMAARGNRTGVGAEYRAQIDATADTFRRSVSGLVEQLEESLRKIGAGPETIAGFRGQLQEQVLNRLSNFDYQRLATLERQKEGFKRDFRNRSGGTGGWNTAWDYTAAGKELNDMVRELKDAEAALHGFARELSGVPIGAGNSRAFSPAHVNPNGPTQGTPGMGMYWYRQTQSRNPASHPLGRLGSTFENLASWSIVGSVFWEVRMAIENMVESLRRADVQMTQINRILQVNKEELDSLKYSLLDVGREYGRVFEDVADAGEEFAKQGLTGDQLVGATRQASLVMNVSGMDPQETVKLMTAANAQLGASYEELADKWTAVSQSQRISFQDLAAGAVQVGSLAQTAGYEFDELNATIASTAAASGETGETVGSAMRTIIQRLSVPTDEVSKAFQAVGINVEDYIGNMPALIKEITNRWGEWNAEQQLSISRAAAEKRRASIFINLIEAQKDATKYGRAYEASLNSEGAAVAANEQIMASLDKQIEQVKISFQQFAAAFGDAGFTAILKGALNVASKLLDVFTAIFKIPGLSQIAMLGAVAGVGALGMQTLKATTGIFPSMQPAIMAGSPGAFGGPGGGAWVSGSPAYNPRMVNQAIAEGLEYVSYAFGENVEGLAVEAFDEVNSLGSAQPRKKTKSRLRERMAFIAENIPDLVDDMLQLEADDLKKAKSAKGKNKARLSHRWSVWFERLRAALFFDMDELVELQGMNDIQRRPAARARGFRAGMLPNQAGLVKGGLFRSGYLENITRPFGTALKSAASGVGNAFKSIMAPAAGLASSIVALGAELLPLIAVVVAVGVAYDQHAKKIQAQDNRLDEYAQALEEYNALQSKITAGGGTLKALSAEEVAQYTALRARITNPPDASLKPSVSAVNSSGVYLVSNTEALKENSERLKILNATLLEKASTGFSSFINHFMNNGYYYDTANKRMSTPGQDVSFYDGIGGLAKIFNLGKLFDATVRAQEIQAANTRELEGPAESAEAYSLIGDAFKGALNESELIDLLANGRGSAQRLGDPSLTVPEFFKLIDQNYQFGNKSLENSAVTTGLINAAQKSNLPVEKVIEIFLQALTPRLAELKSTQEYKDASPEERRRLVQERVITPAIGWATDQAAAEKAAAAQLDASAETVSSMEAFNTALQEATTELAKFKEGMAVPAEFGYSSLQGLGVGIGRLMMGQAKESLFGDKAMEGYQKLLDAGQSSVDEAMKSAKESLSKLDAAKAAGDGKDIRLASQEYEEDLNTVNQNIATALRDGAAAITKSAMQYIEAAKAMAQANQQQFLYGDPKRALNLSMYEMFGTVQGDNTKYAQSAYKTQLELSNYMKEQAQKAVKGGDSAQAVENWRLAAKATADAMRIEEEIWNIQIEQQKKRLEAKKKEEDKIGQWIDLMNEYLSYLESTEKVDVQQQYLIVQRLAKYAKTPQQKLALAQQLFDAEKAVYDDRFSNAEAWIQHNQNMDNLSDENLLDVYRYMLAQAKKMGNEEDVWAYEEKIYELQKQMAEEKEGELNELAKRLFQRAAGQGGPLAIGIAEYRQAMGGGANAKAKKQAKQMAAPVDELVKYLRKKSGALGDAIRGNIEGAWDDMLKYANSIMAQQEAEEKLSEATYKASEAIKAQITSLEAMGLVIGEMQPPWQGMLDMFGEQAAKYAQMNELLPTTNEALEAFGIKIGEVAIAAATATTSIEDAITDYGEGSDAKFKNKGGSAQDRVLAALGATGASAAPKPKGFWQRMLEFMASEGLAKLNGFHAGGSLGVGGLKTDEFAAVIKRGELVVPTNEVPVLSSIMNKIDSGQFGGNSIQLNLNLEMPDGSVISHTEKVDLGNKTSVQIRRRMR